MHAAWRRRERRKTALCGAAGFLLTLGIGATFLQDNFHAAPSAGHMQGRTPEEAYERVEYEPAASWRRRQATMPVAKGSQRLPASLLSTKPAEAFPSFDRAVLPVTAIPNWGAMRTPDAWERTYGQMTRADFVPVPRYDIATLTQPTVLLLKNREKNVGALTAKLFYSTRFFGAYDLDAGEFSGIHPGVDIKLALDTPIGAIGGGRVYRVAKDRNMGLHVIIEHRIPDEGTLYSLYGHLGSVSVEEGEDIEPGTVVGTVGMTGQSTAPHLHLQLDRGRETPHKRFWPTGMLTPAEAERYTVNPIVFIATHGKEAVAKVRSTARAS